jgi:uncharacterized protein
MGLDVSTGRVIDVSRSITYVDVCNKEDFYNALMTNLVSSREEMSLFDAAFESFWGLPRDGAEGDKNGIIYLDSFHIEQEENPDYSPDEVLGDKDFSEYSDAEVQMLRFIMSKIAPRVATVRSRRTRPDDRAAQVDPRRTLRRNIRYGGDIFDLARRRRRVRKARIALFCDVSGSMDIYSKVMIQFLYALQSEMRNVETFVFSTRLTRITNILWSRDIYSALDEISRVVQDWSGGTSIGGSLHAFNAGLGRSILNSRTIVIMISDGVDFSDSSLLLREVKHVARNCYKFIWLNPLLGQRDYRPQGTIMEPLLPYIDYLLPANNLSSLIGLASTLRNLSFT